MTSARFAYAQARLQARHGQLPSAADWQRLAGTGDLGNFLHAAQHTPLHRWTEGLEAGQSCHAIERLLRQRLRSYIDEVGDWQPQAWRPSFRWLEYLPDLPALQHILGNTATPA